MTIDFGLLTYTSLLCEVLPFLITYCSVTSVYIEQYTPLVLTIKSLLQHYRERQYFSNYKITHSSSFIFMASLPFSPNVFQAISSNPSHQLFNPAWHTDKTPKHALFPSKLLTSKSRRMIRNPLVSSLPAVMTETEGEFFHHEQRQETEEDPRLLREIWKEIQGCHDWEGLLDPMNSHLRREILRYGEFAQSCYDSFDFDPHSKYCGSCKYQQAHFFEEMDMADYGYHMCRYLYATSNIDLEKFFQKSSSIRSIWSPHANWMGYVAVASNEEEIKRLGRRDIVIAWRGTVTYLEWIHDLKNILCPAHFTANPDIQIESGFYDLYTTKEENCKYCSFSAREQVLAEVKRLVERFKDEELSITVTGHSLGGALALLSAYDLAEMRLNIVTDSRNCPKKIPITVVSFASPRVGNLKFKERCDELGVKQLRVINIHDIVPNMPGLFANEKNKLQEFLEEVHFPWSYAHVGSELALDHTHSLFLKPTPDMGCAHNLEAHLHLVDGYHGKGRKFRLATKRDIALVNKDSNFLKSEYGVPPRWRQDYNKGMVKNSEGRWVLPERPWVEAHPPDTAYHFSLVVQSAHDLLRDF